MNRIRIHRIIIFAAAALALCSACSAEQITKQLAPGVTLSQEITTDPALIVTAVTIDPSAQGVEVKAGLGGDTVIEPNPSEGRETISAMTGRRGALVGINADYFPFTGDPLGVCVVDGQLVSEPEGRRASIGVMKDGKVFCDIPRWDAQLAMANGTGRQIDGINRARETNQVVLYTESFGASNMSKFKGTDIICTSPDLPVAVGKDIKLTVTEVRLEAANTPIPKGGIVISGGGPAAFFLKENVKVGDVLTARINIKSVNDIDWTNVAQAVGGGPWLLKDGSVWVDTAAEGWTASHSTTKHPRSAAGITADGKLVLAVVDGRQAISIGIALPDLAAQMKRLGCVTAINLDGGGSSEMSYKGIVINSVSSGDQRPVANGLLVFAPQPTCPALTNVEISGIAGDAVSGNGAQLSLTCSDTSASLTADQIGSVVWGVNNAVGFVSQSGFYTPFKARKGFVRAVVSGQMVSKEVTVIPGAPAELATELAADKTDPTRSALTATLRDSNANPIPNAQVVLTVTGGTAEVTGGLTNEKGAFTTAVTWDPAATEKKVVATVGDLSSEAKQ